MNDKWNDSKKSDFYSEINGSFTGHQHSIGATQEGTILPEYRKDRIYMAWKFLVFSVAFCFSLLLAHYALGDDRGRKEFWIKKYGVINEGDLAERARQVYLRVIAAADKRAAVEHTFVIIGYDGFPWAQSLSDGSVLVTLKAIEFCYRGQSLEKGDARLAFLIGHELAHHFNGDFWEYRFFVDSGDGRSARREFQEVEAVRNNLEAQKVKELQADQYGIIYASLAGYDSDIVVAEDRSFFRQWAESTFPDNVIRKEVAEVLKQRERVVTAKLKEVSNKIILFKLGVASARVGRPDDALFLFRRFAADFPGREVYGNIGTVLLGRAYENFLSSRTSESFPFVLSFGVESRTRAELIDVGRGFTEEKYKEHKRLLLEASEILEKAVRYDPRYPGARNSLGCVRILEKKYYDAVSVLEEARKLSPGDIRIENNLAVAYILLGQEVESDQLLEKAQRILKPLAGMDRNAWTNWNAYLRSRGEYASEWMMTLLNGEGSTPSVDPPRSVQPEYRVGRKMPAGHMLKHLDSGADLDGSEYFIYLNARKTMAVFTKGGLIRLVLYRDPPRFRHGERPSGQDDVHLNWKERSGYFFSGGHLGGYFEY